MKRIMFVAGEASGDLHGANLIREIKEISPDLQVLGVGGRRMREAGLKAIFGIDGLSLIGFFEVLRKVGRFRRMLKELGYCVEKGGISALVLIDFPGFNLRLAEVAKRRGIPIIYYISPQVWAWGRGRIKKIADLVDKLILILPFEEEIYQGTGVDFQFVGHPLIDAVKPTLEKGEAASSLGLDPGRPIVGMLPGSRKQEIDTLLPIMLKAALLMWEKMKELQFIIPRAESVPQEWMEPHLARSPLLEVEVAGGMTYEAMNLSSLLLVASGTATLESACLGTPMLIIYKLSFLTWLLAHSLVRVPSIGLVNLVAGRMVVPELLQFRATPKRIASAALKLLDDDHRLERMRKDLNEVRRRLGESGASKRAARVVLEVINRR